MTHHIGNSGKCFKMERVSESTGKDEEEGRMPFIDKLLKYFESEVAIIDAQFMTDPREIPGCEGFRSCIKFDGEPILPPMMTDERRSEMQMLRHQAVMAETRMRARARQKLLERVQSVMNSIDQKHAPKSQAMSKESTKNLSEENIEIQESLLCQKDSVGIHDTTEIPDANELKLPLDLKDRDEPENEIKCSYSPEREADSGNKNSTTQSPRTDSGICSRAATSAELTDVVDDQTLQEPHLDTMAEITDISSGSDHENEDDNEKMKTSPPEGSEVHENTETLDLKPNPLSNAVVGEPKGVAFRMAQSLENKDNKVEALRASAKSTSSSFTTASDEMNKTVISKEDTASNQSCEALLEMLPEVENTSPRVSTETQTDKTKASDFEEVVPTNKEETEKMDTGNDSILSGTLLSKVDIAAFSDSMELSDGEEEHNVSVARVNEDVHSEIKDMLKARPKSSDSVKSPKMLKDASDAKYVPSPTPSSTPDVSRISHAEEGSVGHNESMRSEALRASMDFEPEDDDSESEDTLDVKNSGDDPPKCSTRISQVASLEVNTESVEKPKDSAISPGLMSSKSCGDMVSGSSDTTTMQTNSTDLARYMARSVDTIVSSGTTLPYAGDVRDAETAEDLTPVPEQDEDLASTQQSEATESSPVKGGLKPVRRGSYTLERPSPALVQSQCTADGINIEKSPVASQESADEKEVTTVKRNDQNNSSEKENNTTKPSETREGQEGSVPSSEKTRSFKLTSSMEDLKMKIVQGKLDFDDQLKENGTTSSQQGTKDGGIKVESEKEGKEEHLARYLENLSQVPGMKPYKRKIKPTNVESAGWGDTRLPVNGGIPNTANSPAQDPLEIESSNSQRLSAKFTEQLLNQLQEQDFDMDSLASLNYYQAQQNLSQDAAFGGAYLSPGETVQLSTEEDYLSKQLDHFETLRQQLINQQQEQLRTLMAEQQKQQLLFQQEILRQGQSLLQSIQSGSLPIQSHGLLPVQAHRSLPVDMSTMSMMYPSQNPAAISLQSEKQTCPVDLLQQYQQHLISQNPWVLNSSGSQHVSTEEELLSQFFNNSHQMQRSQNTRLSQERTTSSRNKTRKPKPRTSQGQKVSFSIDSDQLQLVNSQRTDTTAMSQQDTLQDLDSSLNKSEAELDISVVAGVQVPQFPGVVSHTSPRHFPNGTPTATAQSTPKSVLKKSSPRSPRSSPGQRRGGVVVNEPYISPELHRKFEKITAAAKGYLTRRLLKTDKVQHVIQTIKDTAEFALHFQQETPIKKGHFTNQDRHLLERVLSQLTAAMYEIHEIFFELSVPERMLLIAQSREQEREKQFRQQAEKENKDRRVSAATQKAIERRKQAKTAEAAVFGDFRPTSAPPVVSSPRCDKHSDLSGHIRRNYGHLMAKAMKPTQSQYGPMKPVKDNFNKAVAKEHHSTMLRHTNVAKRNVTNNRVSSKPVTKPKKTIGSPVSKTSAAGTKPMKRVIAPARPKSTSPAWK